VRQIEVALGHRSYTVEIATGLLDRAGENLARFACRGRLVIVSDTNVWEAQGATLVRGLASGGIAAEAVLVPAGEESKSWAGLQSLTDRLLALGVERGDHIVAFGGGMIGDLAGFAAAILKRGCSYVQVPTSFLAQVDSSVGGKTAINAGAGKNMVGAFHQPSLVLIDPRTLDTLPAREVRAGYAEAVKYGLIGDPGFFAWCEENGARLVDGNAEARLHAIETSVRAKAAIVAEDEHETLGRRALLNLGHTFAHALEAEAGFSDQLLHGEAVAIGITLAFRFSAERGLCAAADAERVARHFKSVGLPSRASGSAAALAARMAHDKKASGGRLRLVLARGIGEAFVADDVDTAEVEAFLATQV
jgi:3-dehydroquinate synthase